LRQIARTLLVTRLAEFGASSVAIFPFIAAHAYLDGEGIVQSVASALAAPFLILVFFILFLYGPLALGVQYGAVRLGLTSKLALSIFPTLICLADGSWVIGSWSNPIRNIGVVWSAMFAMTFVIFIVNYRFLTPLAEKIDRASQ
jgi:hypothetical protein